jgi:hypothetical protein
MLNEEKLEEISDKTEESFKNLLNFLHRRSGGSKFQVSSVSEKELNM